MARTVSTGEISDTITEMLRAYGNGVKESLTKATSNAASACVRELQMSSPERTKGYQKSWVQTKTKRGSVVYNKKYRLTFLLEDGHQNRDGSRTGGIPHIGIAAAHATEMLIRDIRGEYK